ncbi:hypothetical protein Ae201684_001403 [Aphanomyces euteiches]|uniref:COMM domain-containing protein n=1 Tax=Aphanomyces euteiches TaxID=100861 RepID=A0A6G0XTQ2_9STRA|nr:hypothetical protein Ae201684_001403 [Aphanomyces euteiches]KAH9141275.1 hypothetical protein AeRB84_014476 [Aphanomyces euteiches]KAH9142309.1 hypothetical protein AeRB84_013578 [Aphanomyces euteiches]KAH9146526.1 hypothetical protein AeRB84_009631 [Aphanomyces euteiches]
MHRRASTTIDRLEVTLHDTADAMGRGDSPRSEKWLRFYLEALSSSDDEFEVLLADYGIPNDMTDAVKEIIQARSPDIQRYLVRQAASISKVQILDFDYSVRLVMTSSNFHGEMYPTVLLKLMLSGGREATFELDQEELDAILTEFDEIEKAIKSIEGLP